MLKLTTDKKTGQKQYAPYHLIRGYKNSMVVTLMFLEYPITVFHTNIMKSLIGKNLTTPPLFVKHNQFYNFSNINNHYNCIHLQAKFLGYVYGTSSPGLSFLKAELSVNSSTNLHHMSQEYLWYILHVPYRPNSMLIPELLIIYL